MLFRSRRGGLERIIEDHPRFTVAASVAGVEDLDLSAVDHDIVVIDLSSRVDGSALGIIAQMATVSRPVVISTWDRPPSLLGAIRAGACACVSRQSDPSAVAAALMVVTLGGFYVCNRLYNQFVTELVGSPRDESNALAPREVETLRWIARGFTQAQIATRMGLSVATINTYAKRIRAKLNATNKAQLTRLAIQLGHLTDDRPPQPGQTT